MLDGNGRPTGNPDTNAREPRLPRHRSPGFPDRATCPPLRLATRKPARRRPGHGAADRCDRPVPARRRDHSSTSPTGTTTSSIGLGFDEASGNFQQTNFSGFGLGGDRVLADVQDGSGTNNANFATPPDGTSGRMQMYRFTGPTIDRDGGLDAEISIHEMTHGTSNRLVGNGAGLNWDPAGGMGEGWSDFYALSLLNNTNADNPDARYASGAYATYKLGRPISTTTSTASAASPTRRTTRVNPHDLGRRRRRHEQPRRRHGHRARLDFNGNGGMEVHNAGEIWALSLWEVRSRVIADPAGANGDVPTGNHTMLQLVTDGLKMTPIDPSFTDARDALIDADCATNACANEASIWAGFADRGLGYGAKTPYNVIFGFTAGHLGIHESFSVPFLDVANPATDVIIDDSASNNNGAIDSGEAVEAHGEADQSLAGRRQGRHRGDGDADDVDPGSHDLRRHVDLRRHRAAGYGPGDTFLHHCGSHRALRQHHRLHADGRSPTSAPRPRRSSFASGAASGTDPVVTYTGTPAPALAIPDGLTARRHAPADHHRRPPDRRSRLPCRQRHPHVHRRPHASSSARRTASAPISSR